MRPTVSKPGDKPAGLIHIVIYTIDGQHRAAAFTDRTTAEAFGSSRATADPRPDCTIVEAVVDGQAAGAPTGD